MFCRFHHHLAILLACAATGVTLSLGCGTTRTTDTLRTATEQLLVSDAIDRAVQSVDFQPLVGQSVFLDDSHLTNVTDRDYLVSTMRQHLLASGCILRENRSDADFVVEARAGAVGTDRSDLLFGIPATNVPQILPIQAGPAAIPEVPLAKRRDQRGIAKISVFAYHRETGRPVWQSGLALEESSSNDIWVFGAGPFQHGTVYNGPAVAARSRRNGPANDAAGEEPRARQVDLARQATFASPAKLVQQYQRLPSTTQVVQSTNEPAPPAAGGQAPAGSAATAASLSASTEPAPFSISREDAGGERLLPNLAEMAAKRSGLELTAQVYDSQLLPPRSTKTVKVRPPRETDPIALPQPRFDSL
jgi:hypothetical protein